MRCRLISALTKMHTKQGSGKRVGIRQQVASVLNTDVAMVKARAAEPSQKPTEILSLG